MRGDHAHLQVLEAILVTLVMLGAAYAVVTLRVPASETDRTRERLEQTARDALTVLAGLSEANGSMLDLGVTESIHCDRDGASPGVACHGNRSSNLSFRLESYLPKGAGYALLLGNGVGERELFRQGVPSGEAVSASFSYLPDWNLTFVVPELSCYEPSMDVNLTMVAVRHGAVASLSSAGVRADNGAVAAAVPAYRDGWWNATLDDLARPSAGVAAAEVVGKRGTYWGAASYQSCNLGGLGPLVRTGLLNSRLTVATPTVPIGSEARFDVDLSALASVPGVVVSAANVTVYEAIPARGNLSDGWAAAALLDLPSGGSGIARWSVPSDALYGAHLVVVRAGLVIDVAGTPVGVEARIPALVHVALASGTVPVESPYRAVVQAWFPDWR